MMARTSRNAALTLLASSAMALKVDMIATTVPQRSAFAQQALALVADHPIVKRNDFCSWFGKGEVTKEEAKAFVVQFSVFSNLFLLAQLRKVINSPTVDEMREGKEILANELGVVFKPKGSKKAKLDGFDPDIVSPTGSVEGGIYSHRAAHFEWLCDVGSSLGLAFGDMGKRVHGSPSTLHFCDALYSIYGSEDLSSSLGASFAIEHWANAGFWDDLVDGFSKLNKKGTAKTPIGFWKFHQILEAQHADHTMDELEEAFAAGRIEDEEAFSRAATEMLDACAVFWDGLEAERLGKEAPRPDKKYSAA